jgi:hypothetical protein
LRNERKKTRTSPRNARPDERLPVCRLVLDAAFTLCR